MKKYFVLLAALALVSLAFAATPGSEVPAGGDNGSGSGVGEGSGTGSTSPAETCRQWGFAQKKTDCPENYLPCPKNPTNPNRVFCGGKAPCTYTKTLSNTNAPFGESCLRDEKIYYP